MSPTTRAYFEPFFTQSFDYVRTPDARSQDITDFLCGIDDDQTGDDKTLLMAVRSDAVMQECCLNGRVTHLVDGRWIAAEPGESR